MNNRERALNILNYKSVDRLPAVHFGYWKELLQEWIAQGHISEDFLDARIDGSEKQRELDRILGWDFNWHTIVSGNIGLKPPFEFKVIEKLPDGFIRYINHDGIIERVRENAMGIPSEDDYLLKDRAAFEELYKPKMQYSDDRVNREYFRDFNNHERENPVGLNLGSVMGQIRNFLSVIGLSYMIFDDYELLEEIVDTFAEMQYRCAEEVLKTGAKFDFAHYWEDICFKNGPLVSPEIFENLCAKHYKKRNDLVKSYGIEIISLDCDGFIDSLLPIWLENGVNTMFPIEVGTWNASIKPWREKYGKEIRGVGGMDKTVLRMDKNAVDKEIERLKPLIELGGYIPCPDHRLMPGTKWELAQYYIEKIKTLKI